MLLRRAERLDVGGPPQLKCTACQPHGRSSKPTPLLASTGTTGLVRCLCSLSRSSNHPSNPSTVCWYTPLFEAACGLGGRYRQQMDRPKKPPLRRGEQCPRACKPCARQRRGPASGPSGPLRRPRKPFKCPLELPAGRRTSTSPVKRKERGGLLLLPCAVSQLMVRSEKK